MDLIRHYVYLDQIERETTAAPGSQTGQQAQITVATPHGYSFFGVEYAWLNLGVSHPSPSTGYVDLTDLVTQAGTGPIPTGLTEPAHELNLTVRYPDAASPGVMTGWIGLWLVKDE